MSFFSSKNITILQNNQIQEEFLKLYINANQEDFANYGLKTESLTTFEYKNKYQNFIVNNYDKLNWNYNSDLAYSLEINSSDNQDMLSFAYILQKIKTTAKDNLCVKINNQFILDNNLVQLTLYTIKTNQNIKVKKLWRRKDNSFDGTDEICLVDGKTFKLAMADLDRPELSPVFFVNNSTRKCFSIGEYKSIYYICKDDITFDPCHIDNQLASKESQNNFLQEVAHYALHIEQDDIKTPKLFDCLERNILNIIYDLMQEYKIDIKLANREAAKLSQDNYDILVKTYKYNFKDKVRELLKLS